MAPLPTLEPKLAEAEPTVKADDAASASGASAKGGNASSEPSAPARTLNVLTHFMKGDEELNLGLKVKLPAKYDDRTIKEAIVDPFVAQYDQKFPQYPASAFQPFSQIKVLVWSGPKPCAADSFREKDRDGVEDILQAEKPIYALLNVDEHVAVLRKRTHNKLKPTIEVELVAAESTAIVLRSFPTTALLAPGEQLIAMLGDVKSDPEDMHAIVDAAIAGGELAYLGLTTARDRNGRNALLNAVTRGDVTLCRKLLRRREDVHVMDSNRDTAMHIACLAGRQLIVSDLLALGANIHEKNRDLMAPLNLSCVDEAQGNGEIVRQLVEAGAEIDGKCWDVTPLMAAASGGHHWALEVLLELGADTMIRNGYEMMAMDYARDQDTSEIIHDFMRGFFLPDAAMLKRQEASREARKRNEAMGMGMHGAPDTEDKGPRIFQAKRLMALDAAFAALQIDAEWLPGFKLSGEHFADIRRKWRQVVLVHHPDRLPANLTAEAQQEHTAMYVEAMAAFEAIDSFYAKRHAPEVTQIADEWTANPTGEANAVSAAKAREAAAAATATGHPTGGAATGVAKPPPSAPPTKDKTAAELRAAREATTRAARPLLFKRRVRIHGLQAKPEFNGRIGVAKVFDRTAKRYGVELEGEGGTLKVKETNLELVEDDPAGDAEAAPAPAAQPVPLS